MKLSSNLYGEIEYSKDDIIKFNSGLLGFPQLKGFILLNSWDKDLPFFTLQSVETEDFYFILVKADDFFTNYEVKLTAVDRKQLAYQANDLIQVFNIVHFASKIEDSTVNLKGPLVINLTRQLGKQLVLDNEHYELRYPLFQKLSSSN